MTHAGLVPWASRLAPSVALVAEEVFADRAVDGMRPVRALIRLADKYTTKRLEPACRRAMHFATPSYRSVKNILVHELDRLPPPQQPPQPEDGRIQFRFAREHGYFDTDHAAQTPQESGTPSTNLPVFPNLAREMVPDGPRRLVTPRGRLCNRSNDRHAPRPDRAHGGGRIATTAVGEKKRDPAKPPFRQLLGASRTNRSSQ